MVTEWGPLGFWEVGKTDWGAPIEQNSTEKARHYLGGYQNFILPALPRQALGSYVFLWGQKQERTPTWFSMVHGNRRAHRNRRRDAGGVDAHRARQSGADSRGAAAAGQTGHRQRHLARRQDRTRPLRFSRTPTATTSPTHGA